MTIWTGLAGAVLVAFVTLAYLRIAAATQRRTAARMAYFDDCAGLFTDLRRGRTDHGFARLNGRYAGQLFDLQVVPDMLTFRKLPSLWLMVTIPTPQPLGATSDFMMRPTGSELFSRFGNLPVQLATPQGFPADLAIRTDDPDQVPQGAVLEAVQSAFFSAHVKEVLLSPRGLRIVWLAEEADRSRYLIFRDAELGATRLAPEVVRPLLSHCLALSAALSAPPATTEAAA
ncbi:MAG TPA: hypothetical protein PK450_06520 [Paracoccaceae bacterium]|nr:hypothetical protein [Paracoccaceae bacterium]